MPYLSLDRAAYLGLPPPPLLRTACRMDAATRILRLGDALHLSATLALLWRVWSTKSCAGRVAAKAAAEEAAAAAAGLLAGGWAPVSSAGGGCSSGNGCGAALAGEDWLYPASAPPQGNPLQTLPMPTSAVKLVPPACPQASHSRRRSCGCWCSPPATWTSSQTSFRGEVIAIDSATE